MNSSDRQEEQRGSDFPFEVYTQRISVPFEYPVYFTRKTFDADNPLFASSLDRLNEHRRHRVVVYVDDGVARTNPGLITQMNEYFHSRPETLEPAGSPQIVPGGKKAKTGWDAVREVMWTIGNLHLDRHSFIVAVGGGSVLDMVGFATSLVHRGLRLVRLPTTTLAQSDAGVGVKTGMDEHGAKNFVGTFAPPFAVINDFDFLATLTDEDWRSGIAEAFKVAILKDTSFVDFLSTHARDLHDRDAATMETVVRRCAVLHLDHIRNSGDPFEFGSTRPLDFGHWSAHKIEVMTGFRVRHGQAVAVGIALDSYYAMRKNMITEEELQRIINGLTTCGLPVYVDCLEWRGRDGRLSILDGLDQFQEHLGGMLTVTLPHGLGNKCEVHQMNVDLIEEAVNWLKEYTVRG